MKKLLVLVSFCIIGLTSCSNDDTSPSVSNNIVGEWEFLKEGTIEGGNEFLTVYNHTPGCTKDYIEFKSNGIAEDYYHEKPSGNCVEYVDEATWNKEGNNLSVNYGNGDYFNGEILILNASTLKIKFSDDASVIHVVELVRK